MLVGLMSATGAALAQAACITVHADQPGQAIHRTLFGANICWPMHVNNLDQKTQTGKDFVALAPYAKQLGITILRYPGGLWSDAYRWKQGIGSIAERKMGSVTGIRNDQMPRIGTDEFLRFCEAAGMQGDITVNYGLCTYESPQAAYQEAADWVEYCNAPNDGSNPGAGTDWAAVRAQNGHPAPYHVQYWEIGNEINNLEHSEKNHWGHTDVTTYAKRCVGFARAMKAIDPTIKVGAVGHRTVDYVSPNDTKIGSKKPWDRTVLEIAGKDLDFIIPHLYSSGPGGLTARLASNGVVVADYHAPHAGTYTIVARVGGDFLRGAWSHFRLEVDKTVVAEFDTVSHRPRPFRKSVELTPGDHAIGVRFTNDLWLKGEGDRNLSIAEVTVKAPDGTETNAPLVDPQDRISLCTGVVEKDRENLRALRALIREVLPNKADTFEVAATEWNEGGEVGTLGTALHCAAKMMMMAEEGVESAEYWLLFNSTHYRRTELWFPVGNTRLPRPPAFVFEIFKQHCGSRVVAAGVTAPDLPPLKMSRRGYPPVGTALDVLATTGAGGKQLGLIVINRNVTQPMSTRIEWPGFRASGTAAVTILTGTDPFDRNDGCTSMADLRVKDVDSMVPVNADGCTVTLPPMSVTGITVTGE